MVGPIIIYNISGNYSVNYIIINATIFWSVKITKTLLYFY